MKKKLTKVLLWGIVICVTIEIFLRLFFPIWFTGFNEAYIYNDELGYSAAPGHHLRLLDFQQELYVNSHGTINFQEDFQKYKYIVFAIGDSHTQGTGLYTDSSYPFLLNLMLNIKNDTSNNNRYALDFGVVNLGIGPVGSEQAYIIFNKYAKKFGRVDYVLYLGTSNDYLDDMLFNKGIRHKFIVKGNPRYKYIYYPIKLLFFDTEIGKRIRYVIQERIIRKRYSKKDPNKTVSIPTAELLEGNIERMVHKAKSLGATIILSWASLDDSYTWLKRWADANGILFADWQTALISTKEAIKNLPVLNPHSVGHHRAWVNYLIALEMKKLIMYSSQQNP